MSRETIQAAPWQMRPLATVALAFWTAEALIALTGGTFPLLAALLLVVAPGLALVPLLPEAVRRSALAALAATPALGAAAASVAITSVAAVSVPLTGLSVRLVLLAVIAAGFLLIRDGEPRLQRPDRYSLAAAAGLAAAVVAGIALEARVIGGSPVPGNDWAKYLLYADEIRAHGSLLIDNPFWLLGVPFREDPGVPSLYGSFLLMTDASASALMHGIWVFAVGAVLAAYALARTLWGVVAGTFAAAFCAIVPLSQDLLGWHGAPNAAALMLMPLIVLYLAVLLTRGLSRAEAAGLGLLVVALAGMHRLSLAIGIAMIAGSIGVGLLTRARREVLVSTGRVAVAVLAFGGPVAYHLIDRARTFGGTPGFEAYEPQKVDLDLVVNDTTYAFTALAVAALVCAVWFVRRDVRIVPLLLLFAVLAVLAYSWVVEFPIPYVRLVYYLPAVLAPLAGFAIAKLPWRRAGPVVGVALAVAAFIPAWEQADRVKSFYTIASESSLKGLDLVEQRLRDDEVVVTDRCWSFLGTWLLHTRTLAALAPADIQPKAEVPLAERAHEVMAGTPAGIRTAKRLGIRYMIVSPECMDETGQPLGTPPVGTPVFVSRQLVVLELRRA